MIRDETHNEMTGLIVEVLLQGRLMQTLGKVGARNPRTNLVLHHGIANILSQAAKLIHILNVVQEPRDPASSFQWDQVLKNIIQFPNRLPTSDLALTLERAGYRLRTVLLSTSFTSPSGTAALRDSANPSTRGINDSIV